MPDVVPRVIEDRVPCFGELRGNGHVIVAEVMSMVMVFVGALDVVGDPCCVRGRHIVGTPDMGRVAKIGHEVNTRQIFDKK